MIEKREVLLDEVGQTLSGHGDRVRQVVFLLDGNLASCSDDAVIKVWDLQSGTTAYELTGSSGAVRAMAPLSKSWLASSSGAVINIWSLKERKLIKQLTSHGESIFALKLLSDFSLVSAAFDDTIKIWNPFRAEENLLRTLRGHGVRSSRSVNLALFADDMLATCSNHPDHLLKIWCQEESKPLEVIRVTRNDCNCLCALQDDKVAAGFLSGHIKIYDRAGLDDHPVYLKNCHPGGVSALLASPNGYLLSAGSRLDATVKVWNPVSGRLIKTILTGHKGSICSLSLSPDGTLLATGSSDRTVKTFYFDY